MTGDRKELCYFTIIFLFANNLYEEESHRGWCISDVYSIYSLCPYTIKVYVVYVFNNDILIMKMISKKYMKQISNPSIWTKHSQFAAMGFPLTPSSVPRLLLLSNERRSVLPITAKHFSKVFINLYWHKKTNLVS